jgi:protein-disulfide isomerase
MDEINTPAETPPIIPQEEPAVAPGFEPPEEDTITLRRSHLYLLLVPLAFILGLGSGYLYWGREATSASPAQAAAGAAQAPAAASGSEETPRYDVPVDDDPALGPQDAPITIIEFSDYECPFCEKFHNETFQRLLDAYPGQIRFVYRDFPLNSIHPNAVSAAEAANCANEQGVFWEFHDLLFSMRRGLSVQAYTGYAEELAVDVEAFQACLDSGRFRDEVQSDFEFAARMGVRSTPTFFVNGLAVVGAQPFEVFQQVIDQELAGGVN